MIVQMTDDLRSCSFCFEPAADDRRVIAGPGVMICEECVAKSVCVLGSDAATETPTAFPAKISDRWSDQRLLDHLPEVARVHRQVDDALHEWVGRARDRGISWDRIGSTLGVTRQSAWERFSRPRPRRGE